MHLNLKGQNLIFRDEICSLGVKFFTRKMYLCLKFIKIRERWTCWSEKYQLTITRNQIWYAWYYSLLFLIWFLSISTNLSVLWRGIRYRNLSFSFFRVWSFLPEYLPWRSVVWLCIFTRGKPALLLRAKKIISFCQKPIDFSLSFCLNYICFV